MGGCVAKPKPAKPKPAKPKPAVPKSHSHIYRPRNLSRSRQHSRPALYSDDSDRRARAAESSPSYDSSYYTVYSASIVDSSGGGCDSGGGGYDSGGGGCDSGGGGCD